MSLSFYDRFFSTLCFLIMFSESLDMASFLFSHMGPSKSFLLNGSFLCFYDVTPLLFSYVVSPIPDFSFVQGQVSCLTGTSAVLCREETMQSQLLNWQAKGRSPQLQTLLGTILCVHVPCLFLLLYFRNKQSIQVGQGKFHVTHIEC